MIEPILDDFNGNTPQPDIHEDNLFQQIWLHPTATLNYILNNCPEKYMTVLFIFGGIVRALDRASMKDMGDKLSTLTILGSSILSGLLFGWLTYIIIAWAFSATGKWIGGQAKATPFRTVLAWSLVPSICSLALLIPQVLVFGDDLFRSVPQNEILYYDWLLIVFGLPELVLGVWSLVILVKGIALIQDFSIGQSILNIVLPILILIGVILGLVALFSLLR